MFEKGQSEEERAAFAAGSLAGSWFVFKLSKPRGTRSSGAAPCPVLVNFSQDERICNGSHKLTHKLFFHLVVMINELASHASSKEGCVSSKLCEKCLFEQL